jgi:hypothetical protein
MSHIGRAGIEASARVIMLAVQLPEQRFVMIAKEILLSATDIIGQRGAIYGHPRVNQTRIAMRLQLLLETPITDYQACLAMVEVKLSRIQESPHVIDSYVDACAYLALAAELCTENEDYLAE